MTYEDLLNQANKEGAEVHEIDFQTTKKYGRCVNDHIFINRNMTFIEKKEILAEELAHHRKTVGDITDQSKIENRRQELIARRESYKMLVEPVDIINAMKYGAKDIFEMAEYMNITVETLRDILEDLKKRYGLGIQVGNYYLQLEPHFGIFHYFI